MAERTAGRLEVRRVIPAAPERVFDAWTDAEGMGAWMRPGPTTECRVELDVRVGGSLSIDMVAGDEVMRHRGEYLEVDRPNRLVFTWNAEWIPGGSTVTVEFRAVDEGTEVLLVHEGLPDEESVLDHTRGWGTILEELEGHLA